MLKHIALAAFAAISIAAVPAAQAVSYTTVEQTGTSTTLVGSIDITPQCPAGYTPISGGWRSGEPNSIQFDGNYSGSGRADYRMNTGRFQPVGSHPNGQGWRTYGYTNGPIIVVVYSVCASG